MTFPLILYEHVTGKFFFEQSYNLSTLACLLVTVNGCRLLRNRRFITTLEVNLAILLQPRLLLCAIQHFFRLWEVVCGFQLNT